ncbi:PTS transporter subunit EIIC [Paenibacillus jilunlii]|uniref:PTS system IIA component, Glc family /PTS system IIB component, Glc family /PTS system IIC component, Glc family n=1 Tax=Paenibacillus jilunlii TaxID=682956 RepID=A0A1G9M8X1_9BACL|nr:PTS transporter subunit EIIC [Paenibacillus jilunlii]KWX70559.1 permease [Paenibacillus jilunlii]SDL70696.1 PTS system IIA component, Glc family /PTS system IIB component, Glc family /PTS system IIC component, Glc family [Paenibacillus jilunlii]
MSKEKDLAHGILGTVGGIQNVEMITHCMTRVRITLRDESLASIGELKRVPGVIGVIEESTLQIIVGPGLVEKVSRVIADISGVELGEAIPLQAAHGLPDPDSRTNRLSDKEKAEQLAAQNKEKYKEKNNTPVKNFLKSISNIFIPLAPAFVAAGLLAGITSVIGNFITAGHLSGEGWAQFNLILNVIKNGIFSYMAIFVGINSARVFGASPSLGGVIGGATLLTGMKPELPIRNLFTGEPLIAGQGGIIGVVLAVWILSVIEKRLHKMMPNSIDLIVTSFLSVLVTGLLTIFLIMPFAGFVADNLLIAVNWILSVGGAFAGFFLGGIWLVMVMLGLHHIMTPIHIELIAQTGMTILLPILAMAGAGQVGAGLALWIRCRKNKQLTGIIKGALPVGVLGIGEPLIYGVTLPLGKPFITACLGGAFGGAVIGYFGNVGAMSIGASGIEMLLLIADGKWWVYLLGLITAYFFGFICTYLFGTPKDARQAKEA